MAVRPDQKLYRQSEAEKDKRRLYAKQYRQRAEAKQRDAERARRRRAQPGGAELNRARVLADRAQLGRAYLAQLVKEQTGVPAPKIPEEVVALKRDQIQLRRLSESLQAAANQAKEDQA